MNLPKLIPTVSVIVPNYNHAQFLSERLNSIKNQTFSNIEILLLDDASDDDSVDILEEFKKNEDRVVHTDYSIKNSGQTNNQWLKGVEKARGEYVWIAESDDVAKPEFLEVLLEEFTLNNIALAYCDSLEIDEHGATIGRYDYGSQNYKNIWDKSFIKDGTELIRDYFIFSNIIPNVSAALFSKVLLKKALIANDFKYCGDWSCYIRLAMKNKIAFVNQKLNLFRQHINTTRNHDIKSYNVALNEKVFILGLIRDSGISDCSKNIEIALSDMSVNRDKKRRIFELINTLDDEYTAKNVVLYGYNDICLDVMKQSVKKRKIIAIIDEKRAGEFCLGVPVLDIKSINFSNTDLIIICSLLHSGAMTNELKKVGFEGTLLAV